MKVLRLHRAILLMAMMLFMGLYVWITLSGDNKLDIYDLIPLGTMVIGVLVCAYSMKYGLKSMLSVAMGVLGVYLIVKIGLMVLAGEGQSYASFLVALALGGVSILLGLTIWLGYDYNVIRIRLCMLIIAIGCGVSLIVEGRFASELSVWWENIHLFVALALLSGAVIFVTMDPSMELPTMGSGAKDNIISMRRRMVCTDDAYMLTSDAKALKKHIDSDRDGSMEVLVRSNNYLSFNLIITNRDDGEHLLEVRDLEKIFMSTLISMRFTQFVLADDHITFYSDCGNAVKIIIHDEIQENMNLPLIFGRQLNVQKKS